MTAMRQTPAQIGTALVVLAMVVAACGSSPTPNPLPTPAPSATASPAASPAPSTPAGAADLALEACDLTGSVPCEHQAVTLSQPIAGTGIALAYSSEWAKGRLDRNGWDAMALGLGGWSLDVLARYDAADGVILAGDGSWRIAKGIALASGGRIVPSLDGRRAYVFDGAGRHVRTVDALLGTTLVTFSYDAAGRLAGAQGNLDGVLIHLDVERQADGTPTALIGSGGAPTALFLDSNGMLGGLRDPIGKETVVATTSAGLVTTLYDATGGVTTYGYDDAGRLVSTTDPDGVAATLARTAGGNAVDVRVTTALGRVSTYRSERQGSGVARSYTAPDGTRTLVTTDASGQQVVASPDGTTTTIGVQLDPRFGMDAPTWTPVDQTRPGGVATHLTATIAATASAADPLAVSAWSRTEVVGGATWVETADPAARTLTWTDPAGRKTVQAYDNAGRLVSQSAPGQPNLTATYDDLGRLATTATGSGASAATTTYAYHDDGTIDITGPDGAVAHATLDSFGRLTQWSEADGATTLTGYDAVGRLVRMAPAGTPSTTVGRSAAGRQTGFLPPLVGADGTYQTRAYDKDGKLATVAGMGALSIAYTYDAAGRLTGWTFDQGAATAAWDPATGLLAATTAPGGVQTTLAYAGGIPIGRTLAGPVSGAVTDTLDAQGRVSGEAVNGAPPIAYTFDTAGLLVTAGDVTLRRDAATGLNAAVTSGAVVTTREYDALGQPVRVIVKTGGTTVADLRNAYDARGQITSTTSAVGGAAPVRTDYTYDTSGRLAGVTVAGTAVERDTYDATGDRTSVVTPTGTLTATYDDRGRLVAWGTSRYTFRADGQLASVTTPTAATTYTFDDFGNLRSATLPDGRAVTYLVDAGGNRVGKLVGGKLTAGYLYGPDGSLAAQLDGSGSVVAQFGYDDGGHLVLVRRGSSVYQVVTDQRGSPILVIDAASGAVAEAITYDAWGNVTADTHPGLLAIGFAGGLSDADTGLVKFGAREYDPRTGRWTGPDPIGFAGGDPVLYRYAAGDPVNQVDPSGLSAPISNQGHYGPPGKQAPNTGGERGNDKHHNLPPNWTGGEEYPAPKPPGPPPCWAGWGPCGNSGPPPPWWTGGCYNPQACRNFDRNIRKIPPYAPWSFGWYCMVLCQFGDPHERTADGIRYDFQAAGEFQLAASPDGNVLLQGRLEPNRNSTWVTISTAIAASVAGDRVAVYAAGATFLTINGTAEPRADLSVRLPNGGVVERHGVFVSITWPGGSRLDVTRTGAHLDMSFAPDAATAPLVRGLLGNADGNPANDITTRDGTVIDPADPAFFTKVYDPFGSSWRISQAESLFDYAAGQSTATFTKKDIPHGPAVVDPAAQAKAEALCRAMGVVSTVTLADCILDIAVTGDSSYASSAAAVQVGTATAGAELPGGATPPLATVLRQVSGRIAVSTQVDRTTFDAKAGDVVYLDAQGACANGVLWRLVSPSGTGDLALDHVCNDLGRFVLATAGTYSVEVYTDTNGATGPYAYRIIGAPPERITPLTLDTVVQDAITRIGEWHRYTFTATAGETVTLHARSACVLGLLWALDGPSSRLSIDHNCNDSGKIVLAAAGTYAVEVYSDGMATGSYAFEVRSGN